MEGLPKIAIGRPSFDFERVGGTENLNVTLTGSSSEVLRRLAEEIRGRLIHATGLHESANAETAVEAAYQSLGQAPCAVLAVNLDDSLAVEDRTNMPGTLDQWPNWSIALPEPLDEIRRASLPRRIAASLTARASCGDGEED